MLSPVNGNSQATLWVVTPFFWSCLNHSINFPTVQLVMKCTTLNAQMQDLFENLTGK